MKKLAATVWFRTSTRKVMNLLRREIRPKLNDYVSEALDQADTEEKKDQAGRLKIARDGLARNYNEFVDIAKDIEGILREVDPWVVPGKR